MTTPTIDGKFIVVGTVYDTHFVCGRGMNRDHLYPPRFRQDTPLVDMGAYLWMFQHCIEMDNYTVENYEIEPYTVRRISFEIPRESIDRLLDNRVITLMEPWDFDALASKLLNRSFKRETRRPVPGYVYVIAAENGTFKIGKAIDIQRRYQQISTAIPLKTSLVGTVEVKDPFMLERELHEKYSAFRYIGEWFKLPPDKVTEILATFEDRR